MKTSAAMLLPLACLSLQSPDAVGQDDLHPNRTIETIADGNNRTIETIADGKPAFGIFSDE